MQHVFKNQIGATSLSLPHFVQWDNVEQKTGIIENDREFNDGDEVGYLKNDVFEPYGTIKLLERRKARGDWSRCNFPHPDFVKFIFIQQTPVNK